MSEETKDYLEIASHCIKWAEIQGTMKNYVAGLLKDNDKKDKLLEQKENIIKEVKEEIKDRIERNKDISYIEITNKAYVREQEELLEILDKNFKLEDTPEEEKKIPEKISIKKEIYNEYIEDYCFKNIPLENLILNQNEVVIIDKIDEIIDYLHYLKSKGDE